MIRVTLHEFRRDTERILARIERGERMILTRRGRPVVRLEPIRDERPEAEDSFYSIADLAASGDSLCNPTIDRILFGQ